MRETSSAAPATTPDCAEVSSADAEICDDDADSSSDEAATASALAATEAITARRFSRAASRAAAMRPTSSRESRPDVTVRSPAASASATRCASRTPRVMDRATSTPSPSATSTPATTSTTSVVRVAR